jgi:hypothetical protein
VSGHLDNRRLRKGEGRRSPPSSDRGGPTTPRHRPLSASIAFAAKPATTDRRRARIARDAIDRTVASDVSAPRDGSRSCIAYLRVRLRLSTVPARPYSFGPKCTRVPLGALRNGSAWRGACVESIPTRESNGNQGSPSLAALPPSRTSPRKVRGSLASRPTSANAGDERCSAHCALASATDVVRREIIPSPGMRDVVIAQEFCGRDSYAASMGMSNPARG